MMPSAVSDGRQDRFPVAAAMNASAGDFVSWITSLLSIRYQPPENAIGLAYWE
jgi:hypothetical protein